LVGDRRNKASLQDRVLAICQVLMFDAFREAISALAQGGFWKSEFRPENDFHDDLPELDNEHGFSSPRRP